MCSFHYVSDISGYTEVLYHSKTILRFSVAGFFYCNQFFFRHESSKNLNSFSDPLCVVINVEQEGLMSLTQQMSELGRNDVEIQNDFSNSFNLSARAQPIAAPQRGMPTATPFCSPTGYGIFGGSPMVC